MRVDRDQKIAGFPAIEIRRLTREVHCGLITLGRVQECLRCSKRVAAAVLTDLERAGFISAADGHLELSLKGSAFAQATAARPLRRSRAEELVSGLVERAKIVNADNAWAYRVEMLVVFGSFANGAERPNDVDIGCRLIPRFRGEAQAAVEERRRELHVGQFRNTVHYVYWPQYEVVRYLKARSRGLSIHSLDDWILKQDSCRVIFRARVRK